MEKVKYQEGVYNSDKIKGHLKDLLSCSNIEFTKVNAQRYVDSPIEEIEIETKFTIRFKTEKELENVFEILGKLSKDVNSESFDN